MNMHAATDFEQEWFYSGGHRLAARLYLTRTPARAVVVLNPATGVPQSYYTAFAQWLAESQNIICMTYDYRDFGASAGRSMKTSQATMVDWGVHDQQAARDHLAVRFPDLPLWVIGHSLGGLLLSFQRDLDRIARVITVAAGPTRLSDHPYPYRLTAAAYWHAVGPLATWVVGYMPGKRLRFGEDIPAGVYWQWRRWCTTNSFVSGDIGDALPLPDYAGLRAPWKVVAIADDLLVPPATVWRAMDFHRRAQKSQLTVVPSAYGLEKIGHIAPFASRNRAIWADLIA